MDPELQLLIKDTPDVPTVLSWIGAYAITLLLCLLTIGITTWILRKLTGFLTSQHTCTALAIAGTSLSLATILPLNILPFQHLLSKSPQIPPILTWVAILTFGFALLRLALLDIPRRIQQNLTEKKRAKRPQARNTSL